MGRDISNLEGQPDDTREQLLAAANRQFAERGFYGASIAQIAGELGLTKQALLYHFKRKEDLYSEVLKAIAVRLQEAMAQKGELADTPEQRFEDMMIGFYNAARANPLDSKILMRELLDDQRRDAPPSEWHLKNTLARIIGALDEIEATAALSNAEKFARIYQMVSAVQFFIGSQSVLKRFYGEDGLAESQAVYPEELRRTLRLVITGQASGA